MIRNGYYHTATILTALVTTTLQADIPDSSDHVLHQFSLRREDQEPRSVSLLESKGVDADSSELLREYRTTGKTDKTIKPNVVYDTINAFTGGCMLRAVAII